MYKSFFLCFSLSLSERQIHNRLPVRAAVEPADLTKVSVTLQDNSALCTEELHAAAHPWATQPAKTIIHTLMDK